MFLTLSFMTVFSFLTHIILAPKPNERGGQSGCRLCGAYIYDTREMQARFARLAHPSLRFVPVGVACAVCGESCPPRTGTARAPL